MVWSGCKIASTSAASGKVTLMVRVTKGPILMFASACPVMTTDGDRWMLPALRTVPVTVVRSPVPDEYPPSARAIVLVGGLTQAVKETPFEVKQAVNARGGKL